MYHIHNLAREKLLQASEHQRHDYDNRKNRVDYQKGDAVLVRDTTRIKGTFLQTSVSLERSLPSCWPCCRFCI